MGTMTICVECGEIFDGFPYGGYCDNTMACTDPSSIMLLLLDTDYPELICH